MKIEDYGFIGDLHTCALVGKNGSIDWLCLPRFDSGACFAKLLGTEENGCWQIHPSQEGAISRQAYREDTMILETFFETPSGAVKVIDFMPHRGERRSVIRIVEGLRGHLSMTFSLKIRLDYGVTIPWVRRQDGGIVALAGPDALLLRSEVKMHGQGMATVAEFEISEGESRAFHLIWYPSHESPPERIDARRALAGTEAFWREWASRYPFDGPNRPAVVRSLLTLKALIYAPTGGVIAAATTSLPEKIGGIRNWDYRFCWLRDATFTLFSFMQSGYTEEARAWVHWLLRAVAGDASQLQTLYGAAGERMMPEIELSHLAGYEDSKPVRSGNAASEQFQLDVYGEMMDALYLARKLNVPLPNQAWRVQCHFVEFVAQHWEEPDEGIWEIRGPRRHFTHSKVMAWVTLDRAVKSVEEFDLPGDLTAWRALREKMHEEICAKAFNAARGAFVQFYGSDLLDASVLMVPLVGFLPATDQRVKGTIEAIDRELAIDGLIQRYDAKKSEKVDGLPPGEGVFLPCSFWMVDCLNLLGRTAEAEARFKRLLELRSSLGLLAEEYDPIAKRLVGNFPQAFTHVGLVNSAHNLSGELAGPAEVRGVARANASHARS